MALKGPGVLADTKVNMNQKHDFATKKGNGILGCIRQSIASRLRDVILPLCSALVRPDLDCWVQLWASTTRDMELLKTAQPRAKKMIEFSLGKQQLGGGGKSHQFV